MEGERTDDRDGYIQVKVEPSRSVTNGVFIEVNDHYQLLSPAESSERAKKAIEILSERWTESLRQGLVIAKGIVGLGEIA